ncbi:hypothetical protein [Streptomyces sp. NPDC058545]
MVEFKWAVDPLSGEPSAEQHGQHEEASPPAADLTTVRAECP